MLIKSLTEEYVLSLDLNTNTDSESALIIVSGNEFQTVGAEQRKARLAKSVLANGLSSSGTVDELPNNYKQHTVYLVLWQVAVAFSLSHFNSCRCLQIMADFCV